VTPKNVRARRIALGMTLPELAEAFEIPLSVLMEFELGRAPLPEAERYRPILDRLEQERLRGGSC
jgi:transcriptional regulator with XRE-family HTH domain